MNRKRTALGLAAALIVLAGPALSLTGSDVVDHMNSDQRTGYLFGAMEMAAFLADVDGDPERSKCIINWFDEQDGLTTMLDALDEFKDRQALPVIHVLFNRACGE